MSFNDTQYAAYYTCEQIATCLALTFLALLRRWWKINDLYLCIIGLCLSLIGPILLAFAQNNKSMIFGGRNRLIAGGAWRLVRLEPHLNYELDIYSLEGLDLFFQCEDSNF